MTFAFPAAFLALLALLPIIHVLRRSSRWTRETAATFKGQAPAKWYFTVRLVLACVFTVALTAVAARPYIAYDKTASFIFAVDVSRSMQARFSCSEPTFLDRAKDVLRESISAIPEARVSLFAFDRFAFPVTQLTTDRKYLFDVIEHGLYTGLMLQATQTDIANALSVIAAKRERLPDTYGEVTHVVLLSDGFVGGDYRRRLQVPITALREAGVKVSTVGTGNAAETPIADSEGGRCIGRHIEMNGDKVMIPLRADVLKLIASETGGRYYTEKETERLIDTLRAELAYKVSSDAAGPGPRRDVSDVFLALATLALLGYLYLPARMSPDAKE